MPKRSSKKKPIRDISVLAAHIVEQSTGEPTAKADDANKNPAAVALGRLGGLKGGAKLGLVVYTERRKEIARKAAQARWKR